MAKLVELFKDFFLRYLLLAHFHSFIFIKHPPCSLGYYLFHYFTNSLFYFEEFFI